MRAKIVFILGIIISLWTPIYAQGPDTLWTKTYGGANVDDGLSVQQTSDGGYIIAGETFSFGAGACDAYFIKTDVDGDTIWTRTYGGDSSDAACSVQQTSDGGYIAAGITFSFGAGGGDFYLIKMNANGDSLWTKTYGGSNADWGYSVQQTTDNGYIIVGLSFSFGGAYLVKTNANGDTIWTKTYGGVYGGAGFSVQQTSDSGYIVAGMTGSAGSGLDVYLIKTDVDGDTLWTKTYGGANDDLGHSVQQTTDGGYIIAGETYSFGSGGVSVYLIKTNANGDTVWTRTYGGSNDDIGYSVQQASDGGYIIAGKTGSFGSGNDDVYVIKIGSTGDTLWTKTYGGVNNDDGYSVQQTSDDGYIIVGETYSFGVGESDFYLIRTEPDIGVEEETNNSLKHFYGSTIIGGPLRLPKGKKCKVYDISGRSVETNNLKPGIYFIKIEGRISQKVVKIR